MADYVGSLRLLAGVARTAEAKSILRSSAKEMKRLQALEEAVLACCDAETKEEKVAAWGEVTKRVGR